MNNPRSSKYLSISTVVAGAELTLHPEKVIYYPKESALIISDVHLGKSDHFRKSGIAVPQSVNQSNLDRIDDLINYYDPSRVIFLGDLFHSTLNSSWSTFNQLTNNYSTIVFELVKGNHDILPQEIYDDSSLIIYNELILGPFILTHIPLENKSELYNLAGHIHPGVAMKGKAKQYVKLPCFYFGDWQGVVPAFGEFTGMHKMETKPADQIFVVIKNNVKKVK